MTQRVYVLDEAGSQVSPEAVIELVAAVLEAERAEGTLGVVFVDEDAITCLNRRHRDGAGPTDVLSFAEGEDGEGWPILENSGRAGSGLPDYADESPGLGEVVVCPAVVRRYADEDGRSEAHMLMWAVVHGVLHLLGYDHEVDKGEMREREERLLAQHSGMVARLRSVGGPVDCGRLHIPRDEPRAS